MKMEMVKKAGKLECPQCKEIMVKAFIEREDGSGWFCAWLCGCKKGKKTTKKEAQK